ncbi:hypothetical protein N0V88_001438 [Collariella sp. IMI 366227]|nr:hypothetical protein N0V88_001438 [Collariella sp. IMI 366227]
MTDSDSEVDMMDVDVVGSDEDLAVIGKDDVSNYNPDNILPQPPATINAIRKWLDPTPYLHEGGEYRRHLASHAEGTGQWLTATENYQKWHAGSEHGLLWIKGVPGSGKSVFAATLADALAKEGHPVLFFFFRQIIDANHEPKHLLCDWLVQVLEYSPPLQRDLGVYTDKKAPEKNRKLESLSVDDLWKHLKTALTHMSRVYLFGDALDEMNKGNDEFLKALARLGQWKPAEVKVLITSRPVSTVEEPLREFSPLRIRLEEQLVDVDIATYVQQGLKSSTISSEEQVLIKEAVPGRANGLFLYAKLAMDAFLEPNADVREVLKTLPMDLNAMYTDLLREHARRSGVPDCIQRLLLSWVTHASRPLRLIEMAEMLSVTYDATHDLKSAKALIRVACGPLLEIHPDETVSVVHHSLTEFLLGSTRSETDKTLFPVLMPGPTHEQLAVSCLRYLQASRCLEAQTFKRVQPGDSEDEDAFWYDEDKRGARHNALRLQFPFAEYACKSWPIHVAKSAAASAELFSAMDDFLTNGRALEAWLEMEWGLLTARAMPTHIAARHGLSQYLQHLLGREGSAILNCAGPKNRTPLSLAAQKGQAATVKLLLDAGAHSDSDDRFGLKPLHLAAQNNHANVVSVLLAAGVDPLTPKTRENPGRRCGRSSSKGHTPLMYACQAGHVAAVEAFLPYLNVDTVQQALDWAVRAAMANVVKRLLEHPGIDVNSKLGGDTPLFKACERNDIESIEALLAAGADATALCYGGSYSNPTSPLEAFCGARKFEALDDEQPAGHVEGLKHGIDMLLAASAGPGRSSGRPVVVRLLLLAGADPNAEDGHGSTLLHMALGGDDGWDIIKMLVKEGKADINKRRGDGLTPLLAWLESYPYDSDLCLRFIQEFRPDCTLADTDGNTPLHRVAEISIEHQQELIDALLAAGARIDQRNHKGEMPIHCARETSVVELLVSRGASLEAQDCNGATPLMRAMSGMRYAQKMSSLLDMGARGDTRDFQGRTLLHKISARGGTSETRRREGLECLEQLITRGLDPKLVDNAGNTPLHDLAQHSTDTAKFEALVRHGVEPDAINHAGQTVLHILSEGGWPEVFELALGACKSLEAPDFQGRRPIHVAARAHTGVVLRLMNAGADISAATNEGHTPLHLAAWARKSNTVGLLLQAGAVVDAVDKKGRTPLYYACLSGRPETVDLLLRGGAGVGPWSEKLFEACSRVEREEELWMSGSHPLHRPQQKRGPVKQPSTMEVTPEYFFDVDSPKFSYLNTRLDDILRMLVSHGPSGNDWDGWSHLSAATWQLRNSNLDYTARCFGEVKDEADAAKGKPDSQEGEAPTWRSFPYRWAELRRQAAPRAFHEIQSSLAKERHCEQQRVVLQLLARRELALVLAAFKPGGFDPCQPSNEGWTLVHALVAVGHASLLAKIATQEDVERVDDAQWRRQQEQPLPGTDSEDIEGDEDSVDRPHPRPDSISPLVLVACKRAIPNMDVLRFLVERNASVDAPHAGDSPLHVLARGEWWWQVHEALPYLLSRKPNLEIRERGETPLHRALDGSRYNTGPFHKDSARLLIAAGADVNAITDDGRTCLILAGNDIDLVRLLVASGAKVTAQAVFAAIDTRDAGVLDVLLTCGSALVREKPTKKRSRPDTQLGDEEHALYYAATCSRGDDESCFDMVRLLLRHGADSFDTFKAWKSDGDQEAAGFELRTVVHGVLLSNGIVGPFLELPISLERRNSDGQTLLLAACGHCSTFCSTVQEQPLIDVLLQRGADVSACDNLGRNALHHAFCSAEISNRRQDSLFERPLGLLLDANPSLLQQADNSGKTPLHCALASLCESFIDRSDGVEGESIGERIIDRLLSAGADPTAVAASGDNALHLLVRGLNRNPACQVLLHKFLAFGLDINARNAKGETPVFGFLEGFGGAKSYEVWSARRNGRAYQIPVNTVWKVLEGAGADFKARDNRGRNLLHLAAERREWAKVYKWLQAKALDPMELDDQQRNSLDIAAACKNEEVLALFEKEGGKK